MCTPRMFITNSSYFISRLTGNKNTKGHKATPQPEQKLVLGIGAFASLHNRQTENSECIKKAPRVRNPFWLKVQGHSRSHHFVCVLFCPHDSMAAAASAIGRGDHEEDACLMMSYKSHHVGQIGCERLCFFVEAWLRVSCFIISAGFSLGLLFHNDHTAIEHAVVTYIYPVDDHAVIYTSTAPSQHNDHTAVDHAVVITFTQSMAVLSSTALR